MIKVSNILDRAIVASAWTTSAFGVENEVVRMMSGWAEERDVPADNRSLIESYVRHPERLPNLTWWASRA